MGKNIGPGQIQDVTGLDLNSTIYAGGMQFVENGGKALYTHITAGGSQFVTSGGKAYDATVYFAGVQNVAAGGKAYDTTVNDGGLQVVAYNGEADFAVINKGGTQFVKGVSYWTELDGGTQTVNMGHAYYTEIGAGSVQDLVNNGDAEFAVVDSGGKQIVEAGAWGEYTTVHAGGLQVVQAYGHGDHDTVEKLGTQDVFGWTQECDIYGWQKIENGAIDHYSHIHSMATQKIFTGGLSYGDDVQLGGTQYVSGEADYTWLHGYQRVWADGHAVSTDIMSGGQQTVDGSALYSFIENGGHMMVDAGGVGNQTTIETGGIERVLAGGIELEAIFFGAGTLDLDSANCVGLIDGWQAGAKIDLRDIAFDANSSLNYDAKTGMLTISNGQQSEHLHFVSPTGIFNASSDGHGGTLISSPVGQA